MGKSLKFKQKKDGCFFLRLLRKAKKHPFLLSSRGRPSFSPPYPRGVRERKPKLLGTKR
jgi:hypothetical protein